MRRLIYLASPYSDPDAAVREERFRAACRAAGVLIGRGIPVFSPVAHSHPVAEHGGIDPLSEVWYAADQPLLEACTELIVLALPGWGESRGVRAEAEWMLRAGRRVCFVTEDRLAGWEPEGLE